MLILSSDSYESLSFPIGNWQVMMIYLMITWSYLSDRFASYLSDGYQFVSSQFYGLKSNAS